VEISFDHLLIKSPIGWSSVQSRLFEFSHTRLDASQITYMVLGLAFDTSRTGTLTLLFAPLHTDR
jgi:hypothetical protein